MIIQQRCVYLMMAGGIFLIAGCAFQGKPQDKPQGEAQFGSTLGKSIAGVYRDIGSDGSIKPHPQPSYNASQEQESRTGVITLGAPGDMTNLREIIQTETDKASLRLRQNNTGSSGETSGAGRK